MILGLAMVVYCWSLINVLVNKNLFEPRKHRLVGCFFNNLPGKYDGADDSMLNTECCLGASWLMELDTVGLVFAAALVVLCELLNDTCWFCAELFSNDESGS